MWIITERLLILFVVVIAVSQVLVPIMLDKPLFWLFRKKKTFIGEDNGPKTFDDTIENLKAEKIKTTKAKADLDAEIGEKVAKVTELTKPIEEKAQDPQTNTQQPTDGK